MAQQVRGVVAPGKGEPVRIETIVVPDPGPGEAVVRGAGVRGLPHRPALPRGRHQRRLPVPARPRGRRASSRRSATGVTEVAPGDFVILNWRAVCGECRACLRGRPWYCFDTHNATQKMTLERRHRALPGPRHRRVRREDARRRRPVHQGRPGGAAGGRRPARLRRDGRASARRSTPAASAAATRSPSSAAAASATPRSPAPGWPARRRSSPSTSTTAKLETAPRVRRHPHRQRRRTTDPVEAIRELTGGFGADVVIEAVGRPETYQQAFYARDLAGTVVLVGVPTPEMKLELPLLDFFGRGGSLKSSWYGDCLPSRDFPMLIDLYLQGRLDLDAFVTETIGLDEVEEAFEQDAARRRAAFGGGAVMAARIDRVVTSGTFSLDGGTWEVDNNVWLVGDDERGRRHRRRARRRRRSPTPSAAGGVVGHRVHPRPQRPHQRRAGAAPSAPARRCWLHPDDHDAVEARPTRTGPDGELSDGQVIRSPGPT